MGQLRSSGKQQKTDDDAGLSYLESTEAYKYDTLAIGHMIAQYVNLWTNTQTIACRGLIR
jgi:hypothetical protein